jgi:hypothetical protein
LIHRDKEADSHVGILSSHSEINNYQTQFLPSSWREGTASLPFPLHKKKNLETLWACLQKKELKEKKKTIYQL